MISVMLDNDVAGHRDLFSGTFHSIGLFSKIDRFHYLSTLRSHLIRRVYVNMPSR